MDPSLSVEWTHTAIGLLLGFFTAASALFGLIVYGRI
jgi:hypothetical protein